MFRHSLKAHFSTIAIFSGGARFDKMTANIINALNAYSSQPITYVGSIGNQYQNLLETNYTSNNILDHEEIVVNRNYNEVKQQSILTPFRTPTFLRNFRFVSDLKEVQAYQNLQQRDVDAVITVGNYALMKYMYTQIAQSYQKANMLKPLMLGFDQLNAYRSIDNQSFLDYLYYRLPKQPTNLSKYVFPSMCIGYDGLFKAFQFLQKYREDSSNSSFLIKQFSYEVSELVKAAREQYRISNGINQDHYLTVFAPGNTSEEINFSFHALKDSLPKFANHSAISTISTDFFKFLILLPEDEGLASQIKQKAAGLPKNFEISFIESKDKYAALCASDFGLLHNGQITVEAAACQLPATVISSMSNYKAYLTYLYNGHDSPLNVSTNYEGYQDLLGSLTATGNKIASLMVDNFERPKLRFYYTKLYREEIQKMLAMNGRNPSLDVSKTGTEACAQDIVDKVQAYKQYKSTHKVSTPYRKRKQQLNLM